MEFKIKAENLQKALAPVFTRQNISSSKRINLFIKAGKGSFVIRADTGALDITLTMDMANFKRYDFCDKEALEVFVNGKDFWSQLESFPGDQLLTFKITESEIDILEDYYHDDLEVIPVKQGHTEVEIEINKFSKVKYFNIKREVLLEGLRKVKFAMGSNDRLPKYMKIAIGISRDRLRFMSGRGDMFAVYDVEMQKVVSGKHQEIIVLPSHIIPSLLSILSKSNFEVVEFRVLSSDGEMVINTGDYLLSIIEGVEQEYFPIEKALNLNHPYKLFTMHSDWQEPVSNIVETYTKEEQAFKNEKYIEPITSICVDLQEGYMNFEYGTEIKTNASISLLPNTVFKQGNEKFRFSCNIYHLQHALKYGKHEDFILRCESPIKAMLFEYSVCSNHKLNAKEKKYLIFAPISEKA